MKRIKMMALISAVAMFLIVFLYLMLNSGSSSSKASGDTTPIVTAREDVPAFSILTEDMLEMKPVANSSIPDNAIKDVNEVIGAVASSYIYTGEYITPNRIARDGDEKKMGLSMNLEEGMRAVSIPLNSAPIAAGGTVQIGDHVDLYTTISTTYGIPVTTDENGNITTVEGTISAGQYLNSATSSMNTEVYSDTLGTYFTGLVFQNLKVIALDENYVYSTQGAIPDAVVAGTITFEVTPEMAGQLKVIANDPGIAYDLVLRPQYDEEEIYFEKGQAVDHMTGEQADLTEGFTPDVPGTPEEAVTE